MKTWAQVRLIVDKLRWLDVHRYLNPPGIEGLSLIQEVDERVLRRHSRNGIVSAYQNAEKRVTYVPEWQTPRYKINSGERALQAAVLEDAIRCLYPSSYNRSGGLKAQQDAKAWFATDEYNGPFSFAAICDSLDLSMDWVRRHLHNYENYKAEMNEKRSNT